MGNRKTSILVFVSWRDLDFYLIDTGGMERPASTAKRGEQNSDEIDRQIIEQATLAIKEADLILFTVDSKTGLMPTDSELANKIKKYKSSCAFSIVLYFTFCYNSTDGIYSK